MNKIFSVNEKGRDFVIGDLHGCLDLFSETLKEIKFDFKNDRMFSVGDLIDRGENSLECLELIKEHWFHAVIGNHEDMMRNAILKGDDSHMWVTNGGVWHCGVDPTELIELSHYIECLPLSITIETKNGDIGICHAQPPSLNWNDVLMPDEYSENAMIWGRSWIKGGFKGNVEGVNMTIHGHTPIDKPKQIGNVLFIDTGAVFSGNLTCYNITNPD